MKFYQNIRQISSLIAITGIITISCFSVSAYAKARVHKAKSSAATTTTTTTPTATETTTEATTEATTETATETTTEATTEAVTETTTELGTIAQETEVYTKADGAYMSDEEIRVYKIVKNSPSYSQSLGSVPTPEPADTFEENTDYIKSKRSFTFSGGDSYNIIRYEFKEGAAEEITNTIDIPGSEIAIRYVDDDNIWQCTTNIENAVQKTMFIDTDKCSLIVGVPAVYKDSYLNNTLEIMPELEQSIAITQTPTGYSLSYTFPGRQDIIGEIWYLYSTGKLADWNNADHFNTLNQDLTSTKRISFDGYYYATPYNYEPSGENILYRQPSDYLGAAFVRDGSFPAAYELGYVLTYTCMQNQNAQGYWATGPQSEWLKTDFNIGASFYDTRFNTDFAESLLDAYGRYGRSDFLAAAVRYGEYFKNHVNNHSYVTQNGGYLVEDYGSFDGSHTKTHVSLNHQLAEMNFLYKLYDITREESYLELADKMLLAIEDTQSQWVLADNNLNYALHYTGTYNVMKDYPYLTYNDLYNTKKILNNYFNRSSATVDYLMACKLEWMRANNITGYYTNE